jgi:excisionase family DNA binding protein
MTLPEAEAPRITEDDLLELASILSDAEAFSVLYFLVHSETPVTTEALRRDFHISDADVNDLAAVLGQSGFARFEHSALIATGSGRAAIQLVQEGFSAHSAAEDEVQRQDAPLFLSTHGPSVDFVPMPGGSVGEPKYSLPSVLNVKELSAYLRVHPSTIYKLLRRGELPGFRIGADWRFNAELIDRWCLERGSRYGN